jgi:DNA-binding HxlR family transcriptional regulator
LAKRWYDDACGTALALEFVGERWALLIIRELLYGPCRFGQIRAMLPGISANVLTQRLAGLEASGIVVRQSLPPPAAVPVYALTDWGREAEPVLQAMGRWAVRSPRHDGTLFFSPASALTSLRTMLDPARAGGLTMTIAFRFGEQSFAGTLADGVLAIRRGEAADADVRFDGTTHGMAEVVYAKQPFDLATAAGTMRVTGDAALAARFVDLFHLPAKLDAPGATADGDGAARGIAVSRADHPG